MRLWIQNISRPARWSIQDLLFHVLSQEFTTYPASGARGTLRVSFLKTEGNVTVGRVSATHTIPFHWHSFEYLIP